MKPFIMYCAISRKDDQVLKNLLESKEINNLLTKNFIAEDGLSWTPLEYAISIENNNASGMMLSVLTKDNSFAEAIKENNLEKLKRLLSESKPNDLKIQEQLQIASIYNRLKDPVWNYHIDFLLLDSGMKIYPTSLEYRPSVFYNLLESNFPDLQTNISLIEKCLYFFNQLKEPDRIHALQESFMRKNLLELGYKTKNEKIIKLLEVAGAKLPTKPQPKIFEQKAEANILIRAINESNLPYFKEKINEKNEAELIQAAEYCIRNDNEKTRPFLEAVLENEKCLALLKMRRQETLADFAAELNVLKVQPLLKKYGITIMPLDKKTTPNNEHKAKNNIDVLAQLIRSGTEKDIAEFRNILDRDAKFDFSERSTDEDFTLFEIAFFNNQFDFLIDLVKRYKKYNLDTLFPVLDPKQINALLVHLGSTDLLLKAALKEERNRYPAHYKHETKESIECFSHLEALAILVEKIAKNQLQPKTLYHLAHKHKFQRRVLAYLELLAEKDKEKFKALFSFSAMPNVLHAFLKINPHVFRRKRDILDRYDILCGYHLKFCAEEKSQLTREETAELQSAAVITHQIEKSLEKEQQESVPSETVHLPLPSAPLYLNAKGESVNASLPSPVAEVYPDLRFPAQEQQARHLKPVSSAVLPPIAADSSRSSSVYAAPVSSSIADLAPLHDGIAADSALLTVAASAAPSPVVPALLVSNASPSSAGSSSSIVLSSLKSASPRLHEKTAVLASKIPSLNPVVQSKKPPVQIHTRTSSSHATQYGKRRIQYQEKGKRKTPNNEASVRQPSLVPV
jgi:hypothetical protein